MGDDLPHGFQVWDEDGTRLLVVQADHRTTTLHLSPDSIESPLFRVPLGAIRAVRVARDGPLHALIVDAAGTTVRLVHSLHAPPIQRAAALVEQWWQAHPAEDEADFTVRMPLGITHETVLGEQRFAIGSTGDTLALASLLLAAFPLYMLLQGAHATRVTPLLAACFCIVGAVAVAFGARTLLAVRATLTLSQRTLRTRRRSIPLEAIHAVTVHPGFWWNTLVVKTAADSVVLARSLSVDVVRALQAPIEQQARRLRARARADGANPDEDTVPAAIHRLRTPQR